MTKEALLADLHKSTQELIARLFSFAPERFGEKPSEEAWSAAEIAEHLLKLDIIANKVLHAEAAPANRPPDEKIAMLKRRMEDETKRKASERVSPTGDRKSKAELISQLQTQRTELKNAVETLDLTAACISYEHPAAGVMTRLEWVYFIIHHTSRHLRQLKALEEKVVE